MIGFRASGANSSKAPNIRTSNVACIGRLRAATIGRAGHLPGGGKRVGKPGKLHSAHPPPKRLVGAHPLAPSDNTQHPKSNR